MNENLIIKYKIYTNESRIRFERISYIALIAFCVLSVLMSIYCFAMGLSGSFPVSAEPRAASFVYFSVLDTYLLLFRITGVAVIVFAGTVAACNIYRLGNLTYFRTNPWFYLLFLLLLWSVISTACSDSPVEQFTGGDIICDGLFSYLVYGGFFICGSLIVKEKDRRNIFLLFSGVTSWLSIIELLQETKNSFILYCFPTMRSVVFQNSNYFGYVLCMSIIVLLGLYLYDEHEGHGFRILYLFQYTLQVIALLVNNTFGSYLAVVVAIPVLYLFYHKNGRKISGRLLIPVLIFVLLSLANYSGAFSWFGGLNSNFTVTVGDVSHIANGGELTDHAGSGRGALWKDAILRIKARPVTGFGPEGFAASPHFSTEGSPHNDFLQVAGYLGIPGLMLYLAALISLAVYLWKHLGELSSMVVTGGAVVVCYMVSAFFGHPVYNTTPYFWMILGMITVKNEQDIPFLQVREYNECEKQKKYLLPWAGCALLCAVCLCVGLIRTFGLDEKMNEVGDLQAMRCAELTAIMELRDDDSVKDGTEYWFDIAEFKLIPANEPAPQSFGTGTEKTGGGYAEFTDEVGTGYNYDYSEATDYTGKILKVIIEDADKEKISVDWVTP